MYVKDGQPEFGSEENKEKVVQEREVLERWTRKISFTVPEQKSLCGYSF